MAEWSDFAGDFSGTRLNDMPQLQELLRLQQQTSSGGTLGNLGAEDGLVIQPNAHSVLKCRQESGEKVFVNLCAHPQVEPWHYKKLLDEEASVGEGSHGVRIPLSVGERKSYWTPGQHWVGAREANLSLLPSTRLGESTRMTILARRVCRTMERQPYSLSTLLALLFFLAGASGPADAGGPWNRLVSPG